MLLSAGDKFLLTVVCQQDILHLQKNKSAKTTELDIHPYQTMYSFNCMNKKNLVADSLEPWLSNSHYSIANSFLFYTQG